MRGMSPVVALLALIGAGAVVLVGWAIAISVPGMNRYLKIRNM